ncbi:MAG: DsbC family protein [Pseudomonadota bacterium]|nr:DsbC family protein [Pseudomonadota bacterium]
MLSLFSAPAPQHRKLLQRLSVRSTTLALLVAVSACSNSSQSAPSPASTQSVPASLKQSLGNNLKKAGLNATILDIQPTEANGIFWVTLDGLPAVFTTADGQYIIQGDVIRLGQNQVTDVTAPLVQATATKLFGQIDQKDLVIYRPTTPVKAVAYVFTDADCGYCRKLHSEMAQINEKGIEIRYLAWPRAAQIVPKMEAIWCSEDRNSAMDAAKHGLPVESPKCANPVMKQHQLGQQLGVNGTPAVYSVDGKYLGGYIPAAELAKMLGVQ